MYEFGKFIKDTININKKRECLSNEHFKGTLTSSKIQILTEINSFGENGRKFLENLEKSTYAKSSDWTDLKNYSKLFVII